MQLTKKDFKEILKSELPQILSEYGVISKGNLSNSLKDYGVISKENLPDSLKEYGVVTHNELKQEILKSERRTSVRLTKIKNDLADKIANLALAKEERSKVEKIDKRVTTLENFQFV